MHHIGRQDLLSKPVAPFASNLIIRVKAVNREPETGNRKTSQNRER